MRLSDSAARKIAEIFTQEAPLSRVFLFGSRTNDNSKGGDIDLLLLVPSKSDVAALKSKKTGLLVQIQKALGEERKIDLVIAENGSEAKDPFLREIFSTAIRL